MEVRRQKAYDREEWTSVLKEVKDLRVWYTKEIISVRLPAYFNPKTAR